MAQKIIFTDTPARALTEQLDELGCKGALTIITDSNTRRDCLPLISGDSRIDGAGVIELEPGDDNKSLTSLSEIWNYLCCHGATRHSVIVNLGGGMITDIGGFAAATFKRGVRFINVPTSLLAAIDAAVGGKTGINFNGLKNEIGSFAPACSVIVSSAFYGTLPRTELLSGYGEVLKHALLDSPEALGQALEFDLSEADPALLSGILENSVGVKRRIVAEDPFEHGLRRSLNLGHTAAHAFESLAMEAGRTEPHGIAVAHGIVVDLVLSHLNLGFPSDTLQAVASFVRENYPAPAFDCKDYPRLIEFMQHDKKNTSPDAINFTLLRKPGDVQTDCIVSPEQIKVAFDIARDLLGV